MQGLLGVTGAVAVTVPVPVVDAVREDVLETDGVTEADAEPVRDGDTVLLGVPELEGVKVGVWLTEGEPDGDGDRVTEGVPVGEGVRVCVPEGEKQMPDEQLALYA